MCAPCKPIIDCGGSLAGSLLLLAARTKDPNLAAVARYYAHIAEWSVRTMIFAHENPEITQFEFEGSRKKAIDRAHAWSELSCHRAKFIRWHALQRNDGKDGSLTNVRFVEGGPPMTPRTLYDWAEQHRITITELVGGEYDSNAPGHAWIIDGLDGIRKKDEK